MALPPKRQPPKPEKVEVVIKAKRANCRYCKHGGHVFNYMAFCSILQRNSACGIHLCLHYVEDYHKLPKDAAELKKERP